MTVHDPALIELVKALARASAARDIKARDRQAREETHADSDLRPLLKRALE